MKPSGILNFENVPADAGDPDVKVYVNGSEVEIGGGGGGDSDFTTCELTVIIEGEGDYSGISAPLISDGIAKPFETLKDETSVYTIILYKGSATGINLVNHTGTQTYSGDIEVINGEYVITGDATITVTA